METSRCDSGGAINPLGMHCLVWQESTRACQLLYVTVLSSLEADDDLPTCPTICQYCHCRLWPGGRPAIQRDTTFRHGRPQRRGLDPHELPTKQPADRLHTSQATCLQVVGRLASALSKYWLLATHIDKATILHTPNPGRCVHNSQRRH